MSRFEHMNVLGSSRERGPRRLNLETLLSVEDLVRKEMYPLDPEDIGESIGITPEEIEADMEYVRTTQDKINRSNELARAIKEKKKELGEEENNEISNYYERLGHAFEGFLYSNISESKIFKDVILHKTAEYDDIKNGVDFVAEYKNPDDPKSYIALAMDASLSMSTSLIDKKIERSLKDISHQQLSKVKYFQFEKDSPEAKLGMPRVVVGTDEDRVRQLLSRWNTKETIKDVEVSFEDDPVWTLMALQINEQLQLFINQAKSHNQTELANVCEKYQRSLEVSLRVNKDLVEKHRILMAQDGTSKAIKSYCEKITKEGLTSKSIHNESEQSRRDDEIFNKAIRA